nr:ATP synthase subunit 8 [Colpocephalum spinicollis]
MPQMFPASISLIFSFMILIILLWFSCFYWMSNSKPNKIEFKSSFNQFKESFP